ncbi:MAG: hypothetical protein H6551_13165 [Chitinophagales bacterium]|nr:hypothetical protein [Chitinophagaceae bacterium]MCB9066082.1 hypothetical protein [Chitinophagales bacterium]
MNITLKNFLRKITEKLQKDEQKILMLLGQMRANEVKGKSSIDKLEDVEFKVFSQWGEDGILQYLISKIDIPNKVFVEFGVENYLESNTRFLLMNDNWSGVVIDGSKSNVNFIKTDDIYWRYDITAIEAFITTDNINQLIGDNVGVEDIGILSVDIDGNDYWVLNAINVVKPRILICEYNNIFGPEHAVTVPYNPSFVRRNAHYSDLYFGASLKAFYDLAKEKGYTFVGTNSAGMNAFFVRNDLAASFKACTPEEVYQPSKTRESRDKTGKLSFLSGTDRIKEIKDMHVYDVSAKKERQIKDIFGL